MKLRNKKTGEIVEVKSVRFYCENEDGYEYRWSKRKESDGITIAELNEEWEDYEEPKEYWVVDYTECGVDKLTYVPYYPEMDEFNRQIGNYFETREEAEKAVEKLKAWKRLRDKGFIDAISIEMKTSEIVEGEICTIRFHITDKQIETDLKLLFGGEE